MMRSDLEFLLKEKYGYSESEVILFYKEFPEILINHKKYKGFLSPDIYKEIIQLHKNYPVDYLIGYKDFIDNRIFLNHKTLIPRIETEYWVNETLSDRSLEGKRIFLDIFSGSGCIGLSIISRIPDSFVVFSDISRKAILQIKENLLANNIQDDRYKVIKSDIFSKLSIFKFDVIFANPPYISVLDTEIGKEIAYEPPESLFSGESGLIHIEKFLMCAHQFLNPDGIIFMEFGEGQETLIDQFLKNKDLYKHWDFMEDQFGKNRFVKIIGK